MYDFTRWGVWPVRGAYGASGGHVKAFGSMWSWCNGPPYSKWEFSLFGLFAFERTLFRGEYENRWAFGKIELHFKKARHRFYEASQDRTRRAFRRQRRLGA